MHQVLYALKCIENKFIYILYIRYLCVYCVRVFCSMGFDYLCEVPVLTLDVNDDFKGNKFKCADMIKKVTTLPVFPCPSYLCLCTHTLDAHSLQGSGYLWLKVFKTTITKHTYTVTTQSDEQRSV